MTPYRTPSPPIASKPRPLAWLVKIMPTSIAPYLSDSRWYRRAVGGRWCHVASLVVPGLPEMWLRDSEFPPNWSCLFVNHEVWP